jgi:hypothetical protein
MTNPHRPNDSPEPADPQPGPADEYAAPTAPQLEPDGVPKPRPQIAPQSQLVDERQPRPLWARPIVRWLIWAEIGGLAAWGYSFLFRAESGSIFVLSLGPIFALLARQLLPLSAPNELPAEPLFPLDPPTANINPSWPQPSSLDRHKERRTWLAVSITLWTYFAWMALGEMSEAGLWAVGLPDAAAFVSENVWSLGAIGPTALILPISAAFYLKGRKRMAVVMWLAHMPFLSITIICGGMGYLILSGLHR